MNTSPNARSRLASAFSGQLPKIAMAPEGGMWWRSDCFPSRLSEELHKPNLAFFFEFPQDEDANKAEEADEDILGM